ncbi:MAG: hypothetical protein IT430_11750 [Phycisphaerales bacterium]|nr:hypothetical protein [Phycisphaerales bacterium]
MLWYRHDVLQGREFDPEGTYVRRWALELALLPTNWIHPHGTLLVG